MKTVFLIASGAITIIAALPYLNDVLKHQTKPRIVSWFNWTLLTGIATAAALAAKQYPSAVLTGAACVETIVIVIAGFHLGDKKFEKFDVLCQFGAIIGLILWIIFNSPLVAIIATVTIDFIAGLPTWKHAWESPDEETSSTFVLSAIGSGFALLALRRPHVSGLLYPIFITLSTVIVIVLLALSPHRHASRKS